MPRDSALWQQPWLFSTPTRRTRRGRILVLGFLRWVRERPRVALSAPVQRPGSHLNGVPRRGGCQKRPSAGQAVLETPWAASATASGLPWQEVVFDLRARSLRGNRRP